VITSTATSATLAALITALVSGVMAYFAFSLVRDYYWDLGLRVFVSDSPKETFSAGDARNAAVKLAGYWDIAVFIDADCVMPLQNVQRGIDHAEQTQRIVLTWDEFYSMSLEGHKLGYDSEVPIGNHGLEERWKANSLGCQRPVYSPGGNIIVPRSVWERVGGFDERFEGWGFEDATLLIAAGELDRLSGPLYHFWHRSRAFETPIPPFYYTEYADRPVDQYLVDEDRHINRFGPWPG